MKILFKLLLLAVVVCAFFYLFTGAVTLADCKGEGSLNFLVIGFDSSPANTDVICVLSYDGDANTVRGIQIPRDTYVNYGEKSGKINGFYSYRISKGDTHTQALSNLSDMVSSALGVNIDGYISLTQKALGEVVNFVGGVELKADFIPEELISEFKTVDGKVRLDGDDAIKFVRYRKEYKKGDLDRLDAQKAFIKALFKAVREYKKIFSLFRFVSQNGEITFDIDKSRSLSFAVQNAFKLSDSDFQIATLPGKALLSNNVWYYVINKDMANALIQGYFPHENEEFDKTNIFVYRL